MPRTFKPVTLGVLGAWLLMSTGCEDKVCQGELLTCKKDLKDQRNECSGHLTSIADLKTLLVDAQAKVDSLNKQLAELKAKNTAEPQPKAKGKANKHKAKHKKKGRH